MRALIALSLTVTLLALTGCDDADEATPVPVDAQVADAQVVDAQIVDMTMPPLDMTVPAPPHDMDVPAPDMAVLSDMAPRAPDMDVPAPDMDVPAPDMDVPAPLCGDSLCFSNRDCPDAGTLCLVDPNDDARSCCQPGARGVDPAGTPCGDDGERTCATAVCISGDNGGRCSDVCDTEEDCPATMQRCFSLGIDGNVEGWCLPTD